MEENIEIYKHFIKRKVEIELVNETSIVGICVGLDGYLNTILKDVYYKQGSTEDISMINCFVKGSSVKHISTCSYK